MDKIGVIVRASSLHDKGHIDSLRTRVLAGLRTSDGLCIEEIAHPAADKLTAILVLTGGVERDVLKTVAQLPSPTLLIAHPGDNSLPASLEVLARIRQDGGEGRILFGSPSEVVAGLKQELVLANAWEALRFSRIGLIGEPSDWLVASDVDRAFLKGRLSIELVQIPMDALLETARAAEASRKDVASLTKRAETVAEPKPAEIRDAVQVYAGLRSLVDEHRLSACTVRCFDLVKRMKTTGCYAVSRLNDERVPAGCEGDLQALVTLYLAFLLSGQTAFMGNVADVDVKTPAVGLAHCTCPLSMTTSYAIRSHFESGIGVGLAGMIPAGDCTLFRLGGERLDQLFLREGRVEEASFRDNLCRTQVRIVVDEPVDELLTAPLGNHHILLAGRHGETVRRFFDRYLAT